MKIFDDSYVAIAKDVYNNTTNLETVIAVLKSKGANQIQTTQAITRGLGLKLDDADKAVLNSLSWSEEKEVDIIIRNKFLDDSH